MHGWIQNFSVSAVLQIIMHLFLYLLHQLLAASSEQSEIHWMMDNMST